MPYLLTRFKLVIDIIFTGKRWSCGTLFCIFYTFFPSSFIGPNILQSNPVLLVQFKQQANLKFYMFQCWYYYVACGKTKNPVPNFGNYSPNFMCSQFLPAFNFDILGVILIYFNLIIFSDDLLAKISSLLCSTFCWWDLYFAYFDQKQTLIYSETHVKLVGLTVLFLPFHLYISFCFYTYVSFIYCSFFLQLYITPFL